MRCIGLALVALCAAAVPAGANELRPVSQDGQVFAFSTAKSLDPADQDGALDVYVRAGGTTQLVSGTAPEPAHARAVSADGEVVLFYTDGSLLPEDADGGARDYYAYSDAGLELITAGPTPASDAWAAVAALSADGGRVILATDDPLLASDTDGAYDLYVRSGGVTTLLTTSLPGQTIPYDHHYAGASADATRVFERTNEPLLEEDRDGNGEDIYERFGGSVRRVTTGTLATGLSSGASYDYDVSADGSSFVLVTGERLEPGDLFTSFDLYQRRNDTTRLLTANRHGLAEQCRQSSPYPWPPPCYPYIQDQSDDGAHVLFTAGQRLTPDDPDDEHSIYLRSGASIERIPGVGVSLMSRDAERIVVNARERLAPGDTDSERDLYEVRDGVATLLSPGTALGMDLDSISNDGTRVLFETREGLVAQDADNRTDVYETAAGTIRLVTSGPADDHADVYESTHWDVWPAPVGNRVFFESSKQLVPEDTDSAVDVYMWADGQTTLLSG